MDKNGHCLSGHAPAVYLELGRLRGCRAQQKHQLLRPVIVQVLGHPHTPFVEHFVLPTSRPWNRLPMGQQVWPWSQGMPGMRHEYPASRTVHCTGDGEAEQKAFVCNG